MNCYVRVAPKGTTGNNDRNSQEICPGVGAVYIKG